MNWENNDEFLAKWLNGELSEEDKNAFEATEEGKEFVQLINASTLIEPTTYDTDGEFSKIANRIDVSTQKKQKVVWMQPGFQLAIAASVALIIAFFYIFNQGDTIVKTGFSEQEMVLLPDGSEVKLNASSQLSYDADKWDEKRFIKLEGEAFFEVKKGAQFQVQTENGTVQVLGTSFNVKQRAEYLYVACFTGRVEVKSANVTKQLVPGDLVQIRNGEMIEFTQINLEKEPSWISGITQLENVSLKEVLNELRYVFGVEIEYDGSLDQLVYTGAFPNQHPESAFKLVLEPLNIEYSYDLSLKKLVILGLK